MSTQEAFKLVGIVEARTRAAENDLRRVDRVAQQTAKSFQSAFGSGSTVNIERAFFSAGKAADGFLSRFAHISNIIQGIPQIGQLAGALTRPLFQAAEEGIRLNWTLEQAQIGYEGVAGSAEKAAKFIKDLQQFGQHSPFRFEGLLDASRIMTAMGFSLDEQIPKLRIWGNAIASSGELSAEKVRDVAVAFGQMRMAGRVNAQDMMQLTNANIPGWELLAKAIGKTVAETRKLSEAGRLDGKKAVEAITAMMAIEPRFKDMTSRLEKTGAGRASAAQDIIQFAQARATQGLTKNINDALGEALKKEDLVNSLAGSFDAVLGPVSGVLTAAAKDVLGGGITGGIKEGIAAGKEAVALEAASMGQSIIDSFKSILGINSPSKVFMQFGHDVADGFNIGFADGMMSGVFGSVMDKFLSGVKDQAQREKIEKAISENSARTGIPSEVLRALIEQESRGNFNALSPKGARGIMQLMPDTARDLGLRVNKSVDERLDVEKSIRAGADYLKQQLDRFNGDLKLALAAYNAGPGAVLKYGNQVPPYAETQSYVREITGRMSGSNMPPPITQTPSLQQQAQDLQRVYEQLAPADRSKLEQLATTIRQTMNRLAEIDSQLRAAQKELDAARPAANGGKFDPNREYSASFKVDSLSDQQKSLLKVLSDLRFENEKMVQGLLTRFRGGASMDLRNIGADIGPSAGVFRPAPAEALTRLRTVTKDIQKTAETLPVTGQATQQIAENTERAAKGAGEWKDVIIESEEAMRRLKFSWNAVADSFERALQSFFPSLLEEGKFFKEVMPRAALNVALQFAEGIGNEASRQFSSILSRKLFKYDGGDSESDGGLIGSATRKLFSLIGLGSPRSMTPSQLMDKMAKRPLSTSNVMATTLGSASGGATQKSVEGSMPQSKGKKQTDSDSGAKETQQQIRNSTDKVLSGQQAQTAQLNAQMQASADRIVDGLTPRQQGFWQGLLGAALSGAVSGATGAAVNMAFRGGGEGGSKTGSVTSTATETDAPSGGSGTRPRTVTPRATGGIINGPGTETSDSILGLDRRGIPTAWVSSGEFVVNAAATRKHRAALEAINKDRLPKFGFGGFLKWTSPISHKSVRDVTMPISHEGFRSATMPVTHEGFRNATMPVMSPEGRTILSPYLARVADPTQVNHPVAQMGPGKPGVGTVHNHHYHFNVHAHGADAAQNIKKSRRQLERQAAQILGLAARQTM